MVQADKWQCYFDFSETLFPFHYAQEWSALVREVGLNIKYEQLLVMEESYENKDAFAAWLAGWLPFGAIPQGLQQEFLYDVVNKYVAETQDHGDTVVHYKINQFFVIAQK